MRVQHRRHDLRGILERQIAGAGTERWCTDVRKLPLLRLVQRRQPRARDAGACHRLGLAPDDGVDHEFRRQVAAGRGDNRGADGQLAVQADAVLEFLSADDFEAAQSGGGRVQASGGGTDESISGERRKIVHNYANHLPDISRERRYMTVASSGRFKRSSTLPMP